MNPLIIAKLIAGISSTAPHQSKCHMPGNISIEVVDATNIVDYDIFTSIKIDDIVVHYDYAKDGLNTTEGNELHEWIMEALDAVDNTMTALGYRAVDDGHDGSGGGLIYGGVAYTK